MKNINLKHILKFMIMGFLMLLVMMTGCGYKGYSKQETDLYTVAVNSVLWNNGYSFGADFVRDPKIEILEKDEYGRILFTYYEKYYSGGDLSFSALIILQQTLNEFVYYYEDYNYIIKKQFKTVSEQPFSQENIEYLKSNNDWGNEIKLNKCIKKEINNKKQKIPFDKKVIEDKVIEEFSLKGENHTLFLHYLTNDKVNNFIGYGAVRKNTNQFDYFVYFVKSINDNAGEIYFFTPTNLFDYQDEFISFKKSNGWSN